MAVSSAIAIIVAAGRSRRMGFDKLFADLAGQPVVAHAIAAFERCPDFGEIIVVTSPENMARCEELRSGKVTRILAGGSERHLSVRAGLEAAGEDEARLVAIHDGARPLIEPSVITECLAVAARYGAASCAQPVAETVKRADADLEVTESVNREGLWTMQTPQIFSLGLIRRAYEKVLAEELIVTDEVSAVQHLGERVRLVSHETWNPKITFPRDLALAAQLLRVRAAADGDLDGCLFK